MDVIEFRVATFRIRFLPSLNEIGSSPKKNMLLWFEITLIVRKGLALDEECLCLSFLHSKRSAQSRL